jgi:hypothetical protein
MMAVERNAFGDECGGEVLGGVVGDYMIDQGVRRIRVND